jgi:hypothetical protein
MPDQPQKDRDIPAAFLAPSFAKLQIRQSEVPQGQASNETVVESLARVIRSVRHERRQAG